MQFVLFKLYTSLGARYPPKVDAKLEAAAAGIQALMEDLAAAAAQESQPAALQVLLTINATRTY